MKHPRQFIHKSINLADDLDTVTVGELSTKAFSEIKARWGDLTDEEINNLQVEIDYEYYRDGSTRVRVDVKRQVLETDAQYQARLAAIERQEERERETYERLKAKYG